MSVVPFAQDAQTQSVLIIGSGFSGLCMGIKLKEAGIHDFVILERADDLGGTWRDNHYPGCACDVESHLYSYSFEPNPNWSRQYAPQPEIWAYLRHCATKYGLLPHIRYQADVAQSRFDAARSLWVLTTRDGREFSGRVVVSGMGALSNPSVPDIPGIEQFKGQAFHSAHWDHDFDFNGKRVAVIGSGASAIQFVPQIAHQTARLDYYQRTPPWVLPKPDWHRQQWERTLASALPASQKLFRWFIYWALEMRVLGFVLHPKVMKAVEWLGKRHINSAIKDPIKRQQVTPSYTAGCKRLLLSNDYYSALARPNVDIVSEGIREVRANSVVTRDGRVREVDAIIFGTGFKVQDLVPRGSFIGAGGRDLADVWLSQGGPEAYLGMAVHGFPNLFFLLGPNSGLGHSSMVFMIESQVAYILRAITEMRSRGVQAVDVRAEVQSSFVGSIQQRLSQSVWSSGCKSWYVNDSGKNTTLWPGFTFLYRRLTRSFDIGDYQVGQASVAAAGQPADRGRSTGTR